MTKVDYRHDPKLRPLAAAHSQCMGCMGGSARDVSKCATDSCLLHPYRSGRGCGDMKLATIRAYCLHCCGHPVKDGELDPNYGHTRAAHNDAASCTGYDCPFWPYRPGTTPYEGIWKGNPQIGVIGQPSRGEGTVSENPAQLTESPDHASPGT